MRRVGAGRDIFVLINHGKQERSLELPADMHEVLGGNRTIRKITLASQGVAVLEQRHAR
jgi:beta-galactosidase